MHKRLACLITVCMLAGGAGVFARAAPAAPKVTHDEYVATDGALYVYGIDGRPSLIARYSLPGVTDVRGIGANAATGMLYVSYGAAPSGHLLAFNLTRRRIAYDRALPFGIDSFDISHDGRLIFMPTGEDTSGHTWHVLAASTGALQGSIAAGQAPHDTAVSADGRYVFLGGAASPYLYEADVASPWRIVKRIGPLVPHGTVGIRPFTINAQDTLAFTTGERYLGFQVSDVATGKLLYTVPVPGFSIPAGYASLIASHGIGLSPDQRFLWLLDEPNHAVHEFDISGLPRRAPVLAATVHVAGNPYNINGGAPDWLTLSRDGRYLFVGNSGTVLDTATRTAVASIGALVRSRYNVEVDWSGGRVCAAYPREPLGYLHVTPACSPQTSSANG